MDIRETKALLKDLARQPKIVMLCVALAFLVFVSQAWLQGYLGHKGEQAAQVSRSSEESHLTQATQDTNAVTVAARSTSRLPEEDIGQGETASLLGESTTAVGINDVITLQDGKAIGLSRPNAVISVSFHKLLESDYAEISIAPFGEHAFRFPVRHTGVSSKFIVASASYLVHVVSIDWQSAIVQVVVNPEVETQGGIADASP